MHKLIRVILLLAFVAVLAVSANAQDGGGASSSEQTLAGILPI